MLIPIYRVISSQFPVDSLTGNIEMGMAVGLGTNASGAVVVRKVDAGAGANTVTQPVGIAGDRKRASEAYEWVNRVSDSGDETAASGKMTVYHGGGEFWLDVDDASITTPLGSAVEGAISSAATVTVGAKLYAGTANGTTIVAGQLHSSSSGDAVALVLSDAVTLESGIPGEYEPGSSVDYADPAVPRTWVHVKLLV
jgi:hypothetical protein